MDRQTDRQTDIAASGIIISFVFLRKRLRRFCPAISTLAITLAIARARKMGQKQPGSIEGLES